MSCLHLCPLGGIVFPSGNCSILYFSLEQNQVLNCRHTVALSYTLIIHLVLSLINDLTNLNQKYTCIKVSVCVCVCVRLFRSGYTLFCKEQAKSMTGVALCSYKKVWATRWQGLTEVQKEEYRARCKEVCVTASHGISNYFSGYKTGPLRLKCLFLSAEEAVQS